MLYVEHVDVETKQKIYCRNKDSPAWFYENPKERKASQKRKAEEERLKVKQEKKQKVDICPWKVESKVYVDVRTWYQEDCCPFPPSQLWFCEGIVLERTDKKYVLDFFCFDEIHTKTIQYMKVFSYAFLSIFLKCNVLCIGFLLLEVYLEPLTRQWPSCTTWRC